MGPFTSFYDTFVSRNACLTYNFTQMFSQFNHCGIGTVCVYINSCIYNCHVCRNSDQPTSDHGETSVGLVHSVQTGRAEGRYRSGYHKKTVARDNPRSWSTAIHNKRSFYIAHAVSTHYGRRMLY